MEIWKPVLGFEGIYEVSNHGRVKTVATQRIRKPSRCNSYGHLGVSLTRDGKVYSRRVHCLVLESFVGPRPSGAQACHAPDPDPTNNRLDNLRWDTPRGNALDRKPRSECRAGHQFTPENTYQRPDGGGRMCLSCIKIRNRSKPRKGQATHCAAGHELTPENTYLWSTGSRRCKTCHKQRAKERYRNAKGTKGLQ